MSTVYTFLWYFFIYAFLGWCCEVCYAALRTGKFVNRGFLNGPLCPIYGFGVVIVVALLTPVKDHFLLLFICSVLLTSTLEWLTGFVLEKLFHQKWWDYSDIPFNLSGYICPIFSLLWGFACLIIMDMIHPMVTTLVSHLPYAFGLVLLGIFMLVALTDLIATVTTVVGLNQRLRQIDEIAAKIKAASNELGENLSAATISITEKGADLKENLADLKEDLVDFKEDWAERAAAREAEQETRRTAREAALKRRDAALTELKAANEELFSTYSFGQRRLLRAFPQMSSTRHNAALEEIKRRARDIRKKSK